MSAYQPKTGERCACRPGVQRDNCPACEGTGWRIDFAAIRARNRPRPKFYECGICGHCHPAEWNGDCRDDANRFTNQQLDERYGADGWEEVEMPS